MRNLAILVPLLAVLVEVTQGQLNLPDMPGPPYPDRWGNNRWGVKYDPQVHGRGRHEERSPSTSSGYFGGNEDVEEVPPTRPRSPPPAAHSQSHSQSHSHTRHKWNPGLKPLVSKFLRNPLRSVIASLPTNRRRPYTQKQQVDNYVNSYMTTYNSVAKTPAASSDFVSILDLRRPTTPRSTFRPTNYPTMGNRPNYARSDPSALSDIAMSYVRTARSDTNPLYRTVNPQTDFFPGSDARISRKASSGRNFAKTLSTIYNDYKPSENTDSSSSSSSDSRVVADEDVDSYSNSGSPRSSPPPPTRVRGSSSSGPTYVEKPYYSSDSGSLSKRPPPRGSRGPPSSRPSSYSSGSPLSSFDIYDSSPYSSPTYSGPSSSGLYDSMGYSDSPMIITSTSGGPGGSGPVTVTSYSMSGPSPHSMYPNPLSSGPYSSSPFSPIGGRNPPPPPPPLSPLAPLGYGPSYFAPPAYPPSYHCKGNSCKKSKKKKNGFQHTPMNVIRGLLGRDRRDRSRGRDHDRDNEHFQPEYAAHVPLSLPPPSQYSYNPAVNSLPSGLGYSGPSPYSSSPYSSSPYSPSAYSAPPSPPISPYSAGSPLSLGISSLRDSISGYSSKPYRPPPRPYPPSYRFPTGPSGSGGDGLSSSSDAKKEGTGGPITQHLHDWPRIFTAMGSSVDAVAGGIHAVRKEISKMTGQTLAKGIMMGGSAVHEVSKGMAHVVTKMATM